MSPYVECLVYDHTDMEVLKQREMNNRYLSFSMVKVRV